MKIEKILTPVDGSEHSMRAAAYSADMAKLMGADVLLIHYHRPFPAILGEPYFQKAVNKILKESNLLLDPFRNIFEEKGVPFTDRVLEGPPRHKIAEVAGIEKCDMIIMGSRGRSNIEGLFLGSIAHAVLHSAPCPVLVVR